MSKFCILKFSENYDYILNKGLFFKNKRFRNVYIKKFNPFKIEQFHFGKLEEFNGFIVYLPITKEDALLDGELFQIVLEKTIEYLKSLNINIIKYDDIYLKNDRIYYLDKIDINLFYIKEILNSVIKRNNLSKKYVNVSIVSGDYKSNIITMMQIYDELNFISIVDGKENFSKYEYYTDKIFCDCGLEIGYLTSVKDADIIINISDNIKSYLKGVRKNAIIIDISNNTKKSVESNQKIIKDFNYKIKDTYLKDFELELILYAYSENYRNYKEEIYDYESFQIVKNNLKQLQVKFNNFKFY